MTRTAYVVQLDDAPESFLGIRRFSHRDGGTYHPAVGFECARIFNRLSDAQAAHEQHGGHVKPVTIKLQLS